MLLSEKEIRSSGVAATGFSRKSAKKSAKKILCIFWLTAADPFAIRLLEHQQDLECTFFFKDSGIMHTRSFYIEFDWIFKVLIQIKT